MGEVLKDQEVTKNESGTISHDGVEYIRKDSHDVIASKAKKAQDALDKIEADKKKAEEAELAKKGEHEKIIAEKEAEIERLKKSGLQSAKQTALREAAKELGAVKPETIERLVDLDKIEVDENGKVKAETVKTILDGLKESDAYLFGEAGGKPEVGSGEKGAPQGGSQGGTKTFKRSQLRDATFYQANRDDILAAESAGQIVDDL